MFGVTVIRVLFQSIQVLFQIIPNSSSQIVILMTQPCDVFLELLIEVRQ